ncbi:hypothetical protein DYBT9275_00932 [Dyadobacter sp. CECT 9275]|uniref:Uncharacterized protein n=1 Tax=Dyadobacter helix TaxID=2822344 RepID=A0A916J812_9BACT|nr:hypothetical protein [Dyadobacter sp. CECT 9275]CAG4992291.1 hypothetical protein DYBT9275_00932 [Dyadobacter sp. CECT 9275]
MGSIVSHIYDMIKEYGSLENYQAALKEASENKPVAPDFSEDRPADAGKSSNTTLNEASEWSNFRLRLDFYSSFTIA